MIANTYKLNKHKLNMTSVQLIANDLINCPHFLSQTKAEGGKKPSLAGGQYVVNCCRKNNPRKRGGLRPLQSRVSCQRAQFLHAEIHGGRDRPLAGSPRNRCLRSRRYFPGSWRLCARLIPVQHGCRLSGGKPHWQSLGRIGQGWRPDAYPGSRRDGSHCHLRSVRSICDIHVSPNGQVSSIGGIRHG